MGHPMPLLLSADDLPAIINGRPSPKRGRGLDGAMRDGHEASPTTRAHSDRLVLTGAHLTHGRFSLMVVSPQQGMLERRLTTSTKEAGEALEGRPDLPSEDDRLKRSHFGTSSGATTNRREMEGGRGLREEGGGWG
jgi:hypothetical protein